MLHCPLSCIMVDKKLAMILFWNSYVWCVIFLWLLLIFLFVTVFQKSDYDGYCSCSIHISSAWISLRFWICNKVKIFLFITIIQKYVYVIPECFSLMLILSLLKGLHFLLGEISYIFPQNWKKKCLAVILHIYFLFTLTFLLFTYK